MAATVMEVIQLRRTLWLTVKEAGKPVVVDETLCHPLWQMKCVRIAEGKVELRADQLPDPTEDQLTKLAEVLHGSKTPLDEAMKQTDLSSYPPFYVHMLLMKKVVQADSGYWVDAALADIARQPESFRN